MDTLAKRDAAVFPWAPSPPLLHRLVLEFAYTVSCSALLFDVHLGVHFFLGSPDTSYTLSTDIDRNQHL